MKNIQEFYDLLKKNDFVSFQKSEFKLSQTEFKSWHGIVKKMSFNEFEKYIKTNEIPALKLSPIEMKSVKAGLVNAVKDPNRPVDGYKEDELKKTLAVSRL